jgi:UDP-GlcNAc:undecaprenyl-phosphate GlcNAc-1-phosphate transferase
MIPLVGGISVYAGICFTFGLLITIFRMPALPACAGVLVLVGALDDRL